MRTLIAFITLLKVGLFRFLLLVVLLFIVTAFGRLHGALNRPRPQTNYRHRLHQDHFGFGMRLAIRSCTLFIIMHFS